MHKRTLNEILVSVILPVYNMQDYLAECLDSVVNQTLKEIEIICINDASEDDSLKILERYAQDDERLQIFTIEHAGLAAARNFGFSKAIGNYVIFWDSDDYFELDALEKMYKRADKLDADLCICNAYDFDHKTGKHISHNYIRKPYPETETFSIDDCPDRIFQITSSNCWNRLLRREFLIENDISFPVGDLLEDEIFSMLILSLSKRICLLKERLIHYRVNRPGSIMNKFEAVENIAVKGYHECYKQMKSRGLLERDDIRKSFVDRICGLYLYQLKQYKSLETFKENYKKMISDDDIYVDLWNPEWEKTSNVKKYTDAREMSPEEYIFIMYRELNTQNGFNKAEIGILKSKLKKITESQNRGLSD